MTAQRAATKRALWSLHLHAGHYEPSRLPIDMRPMSVDEALQAACDWTDEHAAQRRLRVLNRYHRDLFSRGPGEARPCPSSPEGVAARDQAWRQECDARLEQCARPAGGRRLPPGVRWVAARAKHDLERNRELPACVPTNSNPDFDPVRGRTELRSGLTTRRAMGVDLAQLLDPRGWDNCSDLFEDTFQVVPDGNGGYREKPTRPEDYGTSWEGLLYELADAGPQAVENILWVRFAVSRTCDEPPYYLDPAMLGGSQPPALIAGLTGSRAWRQGRYDLAARRRRRGAICDHAEGQCEVDAVEVQYELYDSLSYRVGGLTLPGVLRQNNGYFRAWSCEDGFTDVDCVKFLRFARLTRWSISGAYDFGEMLNYTAAAFLSLWIGDIQQIVPCCEQRKATRR